MLDALIGQSGGDFDFTCTLEFYITLFFRHLYGDPAVNREISIVERINKSDSVHKTKVKYETMLSFRNICLKTGNQLENF